MKSFVYLAVAANQSATLVDIDDAASGREPTAHARRLLAEHGSCDRIEVWWDENRVAVVERNVESHAP